MQTVTTLQQPLIAIVDDDETVRVTLSSLIRSLGYRVLKFAGGQELLDSPNRGDISCLISDIQMPGMTGLELYDRLAASGKPIPTIFVTAYPDEKGRDRAMRAGAFCYLQKPFAEEELLTCIRTILGPPAA